MSFASVAALIETLRRLQLLEPAHLAELSRTAQPASYSARDLARLLIEKGWLTPYQVNQLFAGQGAKLQLGYYVLLERLGGGGMGEVFKARDARNSQIVAVKLMRKDRLESPVSVKRFRREAKAAAKLSHPNVVQAIDAPQIGDTYVFVMEFVPGSDLAKLVKARGPLPVKTACDYIRQAAAGLAHAHETGMVHRDIKPHNLLLEMRNPEREMRNPADRSAFRIPDSALVKILDFGLARLIHPDETDSTTLVTEEGAVVGTPDYIAPEQTLGSHDVDIRADLYSLGCTFYFLLTGQPPFPGGSIGEKLVKHQMIEPTPLEQLRPDVPPQVAAIVRKLMAKKPGDRYQTPAELLRALGGQRRRWKLLLAVTAVILLAALAAWWLIWTRYRGGS